MPRVAVDRFLFLDGQALSPHVADVDFEELYQEILMDHAKRPRNHGKIADAQGHSHADNPLCGDEVDIYVNLDESGGIQDVGFEAQACSICTASASIMSQKLKKLNTEGALDLSKRFVDLLVQDEEGVVPKDFGDLAALAGVRKFPMRTKCATLPWHAFEAALEKAQSGTPAVAEEIS